MVMSEKPLAEFQSVRKVFKISSKLVGRNTAIEKLLYYRLRSAVRYNIIDLKADCGKIFFSIGYFIIGRKLLLPP